MRRHRSRRPRSETLAEWPLTLRHLIRAAELECPRGHAEALIELTALALRKAPSRGIFDPGANGEHDLFAAIEAVAEGHLDLASARAAWRGALESATLTLDSRDDIERAALQVQSVSDTAYFYAGLAFGLATLCVYRGG
jgi:hypothetical protein